MGKGLTCFQSGGDRPQGGARRVLKLIVRANERHDKAPLLLEVREEVEVVGVTRRADAEVRIGGQQSQSSSPSQQ